MRRDVRAAAVTAIGSLALALAVAEVPAAVSKLNHARTQSVSAQHGLEHCFGDEGNGTAKLSFARWLKARLPAHAIYTLDYAQPPDELCIYLTLLPALPASPGQHAGWSVAFGADPPALRARLARHDPSVVTFAPGFVLARNGRG